MDMEPEEVRAPHIQVGHAYLPKLYMKKVRIKDNEPQPYCASCETPFYRVLDKWLPECDHFFAYSLRWLYLRDNMVCHLCFEHVSWPQASRDHVIPKSEAGQATAGNIRLAHKYCNNKRGARALDEARAYLQELKERLGKLPYIQEPQNGKRRDLAGQS